MTPEQLFHHAVGLQQQGRLAEAETVYRQVLAQAPEAVDAWVNRGAALHGLGRLQEALSNYDQAVARGPGHASAWMNRALVLLAMNRPTQALESFDKVVKLLPRHADAWRGRAGALFALRRSEEAMQSLDRAMQIEPADLGTLYRRAAILHVEQRFEDALAALDAILAAQPDHSDALTLKAALLCETGRAAEGMACYRRHAQSHFGALPVTQGGDPDFKKKHDAEQRAWMGAHGIMAKDFMVSGFHLEEGAATQGPAVNPANAQSVARRWAQSDPQIVVIDDLLTPEALGILRRFSLGSTLWRRPHSQGYLGAVPEQGFSCPLLAQIADELRTVFPSVMGDHGLGLMWGFKYDSRLSGIPIHADQAKVNVNFWITPDDACRDPKTGGLVVWDVKPPLDWDFSRYNGNEAAIRDFLAQSGAKPITVPYRANRAVIFDSDLFHATDRIDFQEGYENRRINVTMLYGRRTFRGG